MTRQTEAALEEELMSQLTQIGYQRVDIRDEVSLLANFKDQLETHNNINLSSDEFDRILINLNKGSVFDRSKRLRQKQLIEKDDGDTLYYELSNTREWCQNKFQVTHQLSAEGHYKNRYDVTLLINGLPFVQIELKRRGCEMAEAFHQITRYKRDSFTSGHGLFQYLQLFVISNGVNTKYFANNRLDALNLQQTFFWADADNNKITRLNEFADTFLEPCHLAKMISKYIVLSESDKALLVLRPYQFYATERIIKRVENSRKNGYIWHTTGSGKTLTSFKASQLLKDLPDVEKVLFVVDRKDLDHQTKKEFNSFSANSIDGAENTRSLVEQLTSSTKLIVTTIQKLNNAIKKDRYKKKMQTLQDKRMVFIFDECHRSQFGETHKAINNYFNDIQLFGFTGTPIFADNAVKNELGKRTTKELFGECLHQYVITDAIRDENVLRFSIEYVGRYKEKKEGSLNFVDIEVEDIDKKEVLESDQRIEKITDYIIDHHKLKTHNKSFTAMLCCSSVDALIKYYDYFQKKKEQGRHSLNIATIFSYAANEELDVEQKPEQSDLPQAAEGNDESYYHKKDKLAQYIDDYNQQFQTSYSLKQINGFENYYHNISKRVKNKDIDILIVVNMFLTGFDSKPLNTLYVDKNLKHHGLIQAYSRTNRILDKKKSHGNIVVFRNLKQLTDEAIALFSDKNAKEDILMEPYEDYLKAFEEAYQNLMKITPEVDSVNDLKDEEEIEEFVRAFRDLMRVQNALTSFTDFNFDDLDMDEQTFVDYKTKYLDIKDRISSQSNEEHKASILDDIDFELELMHRDEINVRYILNLLDQLKDENEEQQHNKRKQISDLLAADVNLRSKKELIEKFIEEQVVNGNIENVHEAFEIYWDQEKAKAFHELCKTENLNEDKLEKIIKEKLYLERVPELREKIRKAMNEKQGILQRSKSIPRIIDKIDDFILTFIEGMAA
jgi:type I restriction enzyme R subunit